MTRDLQALLDRFDDGYVVAVFEGRRWGVTSTRRAGGRARSLYAEELGGTGVVSTNVHTVGGEDLLHPCEMSADRVLSFLSGAEVEP